MRAPSRNTLACYGLILGILAGCHAAPAPADSAAKIDPQLAAAAEALTHGAPTTARNDAQGRLLVYAYVTDTSATTLDKVSAAGLADGQPSAGMSVIQGWIAPKDLPALADLSCVRRITLPRYASPR